MLEILRMASFLGPMAFLSCLSGLPPVSEEGETDNLCFFETFTSFILNGCFTPGVTILGVLDSSGTLKISTGGRGIRDCSIRVLGRLIVLYFLESTWRYWMGPPKPELFF